MKNEGLKMIANAVDHWLMCNTNLDVEKIVDLKEFIINLDKPRGFMCKDGTILDITKPDPEHAVEIKPSLSKEEREMVIEAKKNIVDNIRQEWIELSRKKNDCTQE